MAFAIVYVVQLSLHNSSFLEAGSSFIWLRNYRHLLADSAFRATVGRAVLFTVISVTGQVIGGTLLAILGWSESWGFRVSRALIGIPWAIPPIVVAIMWRFIFQPGTSPLANLLSHIGLEQGILASPRWALIALAVVNIWEFIPLYFLFVSSGLRGIDRSVLDAAEVDGANEWQKVTRIVLPQLRPLLTTLAIFSTLSTLGLFDLIWIMTQGGPGPATETTSLFIYQTGFQEYALGTAAAAVVLLTVVAIGLAALLAALGGRRDD